MENASENGADGYEVGKGKPPKQTRFKPGQTGNKLGSSKKARAKAQAKVQAALPARQAFARILAGEVTVGKAGRKETMTRLNALFETWYVGAMNGSPKDQVAFLRELAKSGVLDLYDALLAESAVSEEAEGLTEEDRRLIAIAAQECGFFTEEDRIRYLRKEGLEEE